MGAMQQMLVSPAHMPSRILVEALHLQDPWVATRRTRNIKYNTYAALGACHVMFCKLDSVAYASESFYFRKLDGYICKKECQSQYQHHVIVDVLEEAPAETALRQVSIEP